MVLLMERFNLVHQEDKEERLESRIIVPNDNGNSAIEFGDSGDSVS